MSVFYHIDFNQNSKYLPHISLSFGVFHYLHKSSRRKGLAWQRKKGKGSRAYLSNQGTHDTLLRNHSWYWYNNMVLAIWGFTTEEVMWQLQWQSILSRVKAKEGTAVSGLREWTVLNKISVTSWRTETLKINIWDLHVLARVLLNIFLQK